MKIDVLTLFPSVFDFLDQYGVIGRAIRTGKLAVHPVDIRAYSKDKHKRVDDTIYGGDAGMLMSPEVVYDALQDVTSSVGRTIFLSPQGSVLTQKKACELAKEEHLVLLCGHYEGIDARIVNHFVDEEISIGDYVLTGGEIPAMVLIDTVSRFVGDVLGNEKSLFTDSHYEGLLQYDEYTKPRNFMGYEVPEVLLSGDHAKIQAWRENNSIENTRKKRPDLYEKFLKNRAGGNDGFDKTD